MVDCVQVEARKDYGKLSSEVTGARDSTTPLPEGVTSCLTESTSEGGWAPWSQMVVQLAQGAMTVQLFRWPWQFR